MFNSHKLFQERLSVHVKELSRYLRYILNGHTAIAMVFLISVLAVYYQQWLADLSPSFPAPIIIALAFGFLASYTPINTLLKEPDLVFLITSEHKMSAYFRNAIVYSYAVQLYLLLLVAAALGPLYFHAFPERSGKVYLLTLLVLLIIKAWNLIINWLMLKIRNYKVRFIDQVIRFLLSVTIFYFLLLGHLVVTSIITIILFVVFMNDFIASRKQSGLAWELLVEKDQDKKQFFYRMASMFIDVPHLKNRVKRRKLLTTLVNRRTGFRSELSFDYLYRLTFLRSGDYLSMYLRLIIIGGLLIYFVPNDILKLCFAILFIYMSNFQLVTLYRHHRIIIWLDLYPVDTKERLRAFLSWLTRLTAVQTIVFALIFLVQFDIMYAIATLVLGTLFNVLFNYRYVKQKIS